MRGHAWVWAALAWVVVVVAVSTVTWTVIDSAGRNVLSHQGSPEDGRTATGPPAVPAPVSPRPAEPGVTLSPALGETPATGTPSAEPSPTASSQSSPSSPASTPPPAPSSPPASPAGVTRTWQGTAGTVTVRCMGGRINLQAASPGDGWRVEVGNQGPEEVEVELTSEGQDAENDEREVHVEAHCSGGAPRFDVEQD